MKRSEPLAASPATAPLPATRRRGGLGPILLGLAVAGLLAGGYAYWHSRQPRALGENPHPPPPTSVPPAGVQAAYKYTDLVPFTLLQTQRGERAGRRVLRLVIAVPPRAERKQIGATLMNSLQNQTADLANADLVYVWAVPSPRLVEKGVLFTSMSIVSGRLYYVNDGKGLDGKGPKGVNMMITELPLSDTPPPVKDLDLAIDAAAAVAAKGSDVSQLATLARFAAQRHVPLPELQQAVQRVLDYYPRIPAKEVPPGMG